MFIFYMFINKCAQYTEIYYVNTNFFWMQLIAFTHGTALQYVYYNTC